MISDSEAALYVVSDVHGHRAALIAALTEADLIDDAEHWSGGEARLWCLGDLFDRGSDGVGVVELLMRLSQEAAAAGGLVDTLVGNHEVLMLGARRFDETEVIDAAGSSRNFATWWHLNGGRPEDADRLSDEQADWLVDRLAVAVVDDHLLVHSDTDQYLGYGNTVDEVNEHISRVLHGDDVTDWWSLFRDLTQRRGFEGEDGPHEAKALMAKLGGKQIVHGHSTIGDATGVAPAEVTGPRRYCEGLVLCVDGGVYQGGPCLLTRLPMAAD